MQLPATPLPIANVSYQLGTYKGLSPCKLITMPDIQIEVLTDEVKTLSARNTPSLKDKWLITDEVCKLLDVSKRKLQQMRTQNVIKYKKSDKKIYYKASDIQNYLEGC